MTTFVLPGFKAKPKARPYNGKGRMFMPREYTDWKASVRRYLAETYAPEPLLTPCTIDIEIRAPSKPRGDLDNLAGGLLDAIQPPRARGDLRAQHALEARTSLRERLTAAPGALIADDKQVVRLGIAWVESKARSILIRLAEPPTVSAIPTEILEEIT